MKILIYTHNFCPMINGISKNCLNVAKYLSSQNHEVIIVATRYNDMRGFCDKKQPFKIIRTFKRKNSVLRNISLGVPCAFSTVLKYKPDFIFTVDLEALIVSSIVSLLLWKKLIVYLGGSDIYYYISSYKKERRLKNRISKSFKSYTYKFILYKSHKIIVASEFIQKLLCSLVIFSEKIYVLTPTVDTHIFGRSNQRIVDELRSRLRLEDKKIILTVARLDPAKGQDKVIEALPKVINHIRNVHYIIVGDGPYKEALHNLVNSLGMDQRVSFTGHVPYEVLPYYYDLCDVFVMVSRPIGSTEEGFGGVFLEAAYRGKAVIGGECGGVSEAITNNLTGLLVNPMNVGEIAEKIIYLLSNDDIAKSMGRHAQEKWRLKTFDKQVDKIFT